MMMSSDRRSVPGQKIQTRLLITEIA